ncbi:MAG: Rpn family recombination-promoting nuclease/putative transposase [Acidaminococcaceae bacterium]|nr:Rpn family recombination-promoting nuclease/putative transposase [Acidaminococcaceae bacterium]
MTKNYKNFKVDNRMNDAFAKFIFANEKRKQLTLDLINGFFELEGTAVIQDLEFSDRELDREVEEGKGVVLDVVGRSCDGTLVNVEIQLEQFQEMGKRTLYYWSQLYHRRLKKGEEYPELARTVTLNLLDYRLFKDEEWPEYHSCFAVLNTKDMQHRLTNNLEIHFVELPKWKHDGSRQMKRLERWLMYLSSKTTDEERRMLAMEDENIRTAMEAEKEFAKDPLLITAYEQHQKYLWDKHAREAFVREEGEAIGYEKGKAEGIAEGKVEALKAFVAVLRASGKSEEEIAEICKKIKSM